MNTDTMKVEVETETCCVCGAGGEELWTPEEHDVGAPPEDPPLRAMLLHLNHTKTVPGGRLCARCIQRAQDAYSFSTSLAARGPPPLADKIRALRSRLAELTAKIDVFIVVGGGTGGAYSEDDIIMVDKQALAAAAERDARAPAPAASLAGERCYQCTVCPRTFQRSSEYVSHVEEHGPEAVHSCWTCGAQFSAREAAEQHAAQHGAPGGAGVGPQACPACGARPGSRAALRAHVAGAHPAVCAACLRPFPSAAERLAHSLTHAGARHFLCGYDGCILRFTTRASLVSHLRKCHGGAAPPPAPAPAASAPAPPPTTVPCASCDRVFGSAAAMKRHARVHLKLAQEGTEWAAEAEGEAEGRVEYLEVEALEDMEEAGAA